MERMLISPFVVTTMYNSMCVLQVTRYSGNWVCDRFVVWIYYKTACGKWSKKNKGRKRTQKINKHWRTSCLTNTWIDIRKRGLYAHTALCWSLRGSLNKLWSFSTGNMMQCKRRCGVLSSNNINASISKRLFSCSFFAAQMNSLL